MDYRTMIAAAIGTALGYAVTKEMKSRIDLTYRSEEQLMNDIAIGHALDVIRAEREDENHVRFPRN